ANAVRAARSGGIMVQIRVRRSSIAIALAMGAVACAGEPQDGTSPPGAPEAHGPGFGERPPARCSVVKSGVAISDGHGTAPSVARSGQTLGVAWTTPEDAEVRVAILDNEWQKQTELSLAKAPDVQEATIYPDDAGFMVLWSSPHSVMGQYVDTTGDVSGAPTE